MAPIRLTILGEPASKSNSRKLVTNRRTGRPMFIKSDKGRAYAAAIERQVAPLPRLLTGRLIVHIRVFYASERPDLDESIILDGLQGKTYGNDRQVREKHVYHAIDRANPRADVVIETTEPQQLELEAA